MKYTPSEFRVFMDEEEEFKFEEKRYAEIAKNTEEKYAGLEESQVDLRMQKMAELIIQHDEPSLNIGVGFANLERILPKERKKIALDICKEFLDRLNGIDNLECNLGKAEKMPFKDNSIPTITSQSTFQVLVDQEKFLQELARVLKPGGFFAITIEYYWNYPRKPQKFYAHEADKLASYISSLGLNVTEIKYINEEGEWVQTLEEGFSMWILGEKLVHM